MCQIIFVYYILITDKTLNSSINFRVKFKFTTYRLFFNFQKILLLVYFFVITNDGQWVGMYALDSIVSVEVEEPQDEA